MVFYRHLLNDYTHYSYYIVDQRRNVALMAADGARSHLHHRCIARALDDSSALAHLDDTTQEHAHDREEIFCSIAPLEFLPAIKHVSLHSCGIQQSNKFPPVCISSESNQNTSRSISRHRRDQFAGQNVITGLSKFIKVQTTKLIYPEFYVVRNYPDNGINITLS